MKKKTVYVPQAIAEATCVPQGLGERRFKSLFPDAPLLEEGRPGQWTADWSKYQGVFDAAEIAARFTHGRQAREWSRRCAALGVSRPSDSFVNPGHPEVKMDARCRAQLKLAAQLSTAALALP